MPYPVWYALQQHIVKHLGVYLENLTLLFIAAISSAPEQFPRTFQALWTWGRETLQTATPARFARPNLPPPPPPAKPKETE